MIAEIYVRTDRSSKFRNLIKDIGKVLNIVETKSDPVNNKGTLLFLIECSPENEQAISDYGFYSFIDNEKLNNFY